MEAAKELETSSEAKGRGEGSAANPMRNIFISKLIINIGTGADQQKQANAREILQTITNSKPANAISRHRLPEFKISKGQEIGAFVTLRGAKAAETLKRLLDAVDRKLAKRQVSNNALNFGIKEYIDITGVKYNAKIGMLGMNVNVVFERPGARVSARKRARSEEGKRHKLVSPEEIIEYMKKNFNTIIE